ncbi:unnamed protein product [Ambrosiozyma monospora]|uniref:Glucosidase II subunit alpha n=1 Tax=Ambrosiozyma monospora TaxID=43982 RepID=A0A9W6Z2U6_AMBMO|nr:unnamed protein product [Ambrosiozyma monospora]
MRVQLWQLIWAAIAILLNPLQTYAVKEYLFKKCDQSGFCSRNRHFATEVIKQGPDYNSRYFIDLPSLKINDDEGVFDAKILKELNDGSHVDLSLHVSLLSGNNLRFQINEVNRQSEQSLIQDKRYDEASKWAFVKEPELVPFQHELDSDQLILTYGEHYEAKFDLHPFKLTLLYKGVPSLIVNDRNLLNVEHLRTRKQDEEENSIHISPEESTFDTYKDSFKDSKGDTLPHGPESVGLDFTFANSLTVYGIPEHADTLSLKDTTDGEPYRLFNVDIFEYLTQSRLPMYGSIPFMLSTNSKHSSGLFWVNSADTYIDIKKVHKVEADEKKIIPEEAQSQRVQTHWMSENGIVDVILFVKDSPSEVTQAYASITGNTQLPNFFSLGYHQSRWNYNDEADVLDINSKFDEHQIPYDTIWLDVEYTIEKKYFTWEPKMFPNPDRMLSKLDETGRSLVAIIDPHLKVGYEVSDVVEKQNLGIRTSDNSTTCSWFKFHGSSSKLVFME